MRAENVRNCTVLFFNQCISKPFCLAHGFSKNTLSGPPANRLPDCNIFPGVALFPANQNVQLVRCEVVLFYELPTFLALWADAFRSRVFIIV